MNFTAEYMINKDKVNEEEEGECISNPLGVSNINFFNEYINQWCNSDNIIKEILTTSMVSYKIKSFLNFYWK